MKVKQVIDFLSKISPDAEVIIYQDYGYGYIGKILTGVFFETDYNNDFLVDERIIINPKEVKAVCIYPEDYKVVGVSKATTQ